MTNAEKPAFPMKVNPQEIRRADSEYNGLTKREYFAAMAMQGILSRTERVVQKGFVDGRTVICNPDDLAKLSIEVAIELLRQPETTTK